MTKYGPPEADESASPACPDMMGTDAPEASTPSDQPALAAEAVPAVESDAVEPAEPMDEAFDAAEPDGHADPATDAALSTEDGADEDAEAAEDEVDPWDSFDAAKLATIARSGHDPVPFIRDIVSRNAAEAAEAAEAAPEPAPRPTGDSGTITNAAVRSHRARRAHRMDRWATLRDAFRDTDGDGKEAHAAAEPEPLVDAPLTPLDRIRARDASEATAAHDPMADPALDQGYAPYDDSVFGGSGTDETGTLPPAQDDLLPAPSQAPMFGAVEERVWDTPADNEMSRGGRLAWRIAVYGSLVAAPLVLLLTSPFAPKDAVAHYVAAAGCTAAGYAGLAPAKVGTPGYHAHLDENGNGIACEPTVQRTLKGNGQVAFIRVGDHQ